jgi:hypothetical protein
MQNLKVPDSLCALSFGPLLIRWHKKKRALSASADNCLNVNTCQRMSDLDFAERNGFCFRGAEGFTVTRKRGHHSSSGVTVSANGEPAPLLNNVGSSIWTILGCNEA